MSIRVKLDHFPCSLVFFQFHQKTTKNPIKSLNSTLPKVTDGAFECGGVGTGRHKRLGCEGGRAERAGLVGEVLGGSGKMLCNGLT